MFTRREMIAEMAKYFEVKPEVGIFWYHPIDKELFSVYSIPAEYCAETYPKSEIEIWNNLKKRAKKYQKEGRCFDSIYLKDYNQVPRGRIFHKEYSTFYVYVGSWITEKIKKLIIKEFNLQKCTVNFEIDLGYELGHGLDEFLIVKNQSH